MSTTSDLPSISEVVFFDPRKFAIGKRFPPNITAVKPNEIRASLHLKCKFFTTQKLGTTRKVETILSLSPSWGLGNLVGFLRKFPAKTFWFWISYVVITRVEDSWIVWRLQFLTLRCLYCAVLEMKSQVRIKLLQRHPRSCAQSLHATSNTFRQDQRHCAFLQGLRISAWC